MLNVLLVDDEYFIAQGLLHLIDWGAEGYQIVSIASNGMEALEYLKENKVDLIIADIKMPVMSGLELLENIRERGMLETNFVILSGYNEFEYAKRAMRSDCMGYLLKPVQKEELLTILRKINHLSESARQEIENQKKMEEAYLARNIISLLIGKYDEINLKNIKSHMQLSRGVRYIDIAFSGLKSHEEEESKMRELQRKLYLVCREILQEDRTHCIFDVSQDTSSFDVGVIYCEYMAERMNCTEEDYLKCLHKQLEEKLCQKIRFLVGKKVGDIATISQSYGTACVLRTLEGFKSEKEIYIYEKEIQIKSKGILLCKKSLDDLLLSIEQNDHAKIPKNVNNLFDEMKTNGAWGDALNLNINYLLFSLIHLATELDSEVNQEEVLQFISTSSFEDGIMRGSSRHLTSFACEYAEYLQQLRKHVSVGVLQRIEKEIHEHYAENLTLRNLGQRYYINSSYLGQIFHKKYGQSFKDYLSAYRIQESCTLLLKTDMKINDIAEHVGYKDSDYFIRKFIEQKGCTPSKYRRQKS